jgi:hypothetical protein
MNARKKLNAGHFYGCLFFAALAGWLTSSWLVFFLAGGVLLAGGLHAGDIRLEQPRRPAGRQHRG